MARSMEVGAGTLAPGQRQMGSARIPYPGQAEIALDACQTRLVFFLITTINYPEEEEGKKHPITTKQPPNFFCWNLLSMAHWLYVIKQAAGALPGGCSSQDSQPEHSAPVTTVSVRGVPGEERPEEGAAAVALCPAHPSHPGLCSGHLPESRTGMHLGPAAPHHPEPLLLSLR